MAISNWQLAALVPYDNTVSGLVSTNVQAAIDELAIDSGNFIRKNGNSFGEAFSIGSNDNFSVSLEANGVDTITLDPSTPKAVVGYAEAGNVHQTFINTDGYPASWPLPAANTRSALFTYGDMADANDVGDVISCNAAYMTISDTRLYEYIYMNYYFFHVPAGVTGGSIETAYAFFNDMFIESTTADFGSGGGLTGMRSQLRTKNPNVSTGIGFFVNTEGFTGTDGLIKDARGLVASVYTSLTANTTSVTADACRAVGVHVYQVNATGSSTDNSAYGLLISDNISHAGTGSSYAIRSESTAESYVEGLTTFKSGTIVGNDVRDTINPYVYKLVVGQSSDGEGTSALTQFNQLTLTGTSDGGSLQGAFVSKIIFEHDTGEYTTVKAFRNSAIHNGQGNIDTLTLCEMEFQTQSGIATIGTVGGVIAMQVGVGADNGIIRNATGFQFNSLQAVGSDAGQTHTAMGLFYNLVSVYSSGGDTNESYGIRIGDTGVTATGGVTTKAYGIKIDDGAISASGGSGTNTQYAIRVDDTSENYFEGLSTFKSGVKVKDTGAGSTTLSHYQEVAESDLGTLTWTAGVAPSGTITKKYRATRVGNRVDLWCRIEASVAGTAVTAVSFPLPSDTGISTPVAFTGMGNGEQNIVGSGAITVGGTVSTTGPDCSYLGKTGGGVWTVTIVGPSLAADTAYCHLTYFV